MWRRLRRSRLRCEAGRYLLMVIDELALRAGGALCGSWASIRFGEAEWCIWLSGVDARRVCGFEGYRFCPWSAVVSI